MTDKKTLKYLTNGTVFTAPRSGDAGFDLRAKDPATLFKGQQHTIPTGVKLEIPDGYVGIIRDRSSMANRRIYTHGGVIDSSFRGEVTVMLENCNESNYHIEPGDKIAQILFVPVLVDFVLVEAEELTDTERGSSGFGSTGK